MYFWLGVLLPVMHVGLVVLPRKSFYILFGGFMSICLLSVLCALPSLNHTDGAASQFQSMALALVACFILTGMLSGFLLWRRFIALAHAGAIGTADAKKYTAQWSRLVAQPNFVAGLAKLQIAWDEAQAAASPAVKSQKSVADIEALFRQADAANLLLQPMAKAWAMAVGGEHHAAPVKGEERALQKVFRSYQGDWRRLCDLCRTTIVLDTPDEIAACLNHIAADPAVELLVGHRTKCRVRESFDAEKLSGGYRDVQLSAKLRSVDAVSGHLSTHVVEIQLHLRAIYELKSGGGHKQYVSARNLRGD